MKKVIDIEACCGCGACSEICPKKCISMESDIEGFLYPNIDEDTCIHCGQCNEVCPFQQTKEITEENISAFAAQSKDICLRMNSSSGGIFPELAKYFLDNNGVVVGASFSDDFSEVIHIISDSTKTVSSLFGSKYVQSRMTLYKSILEHLNNGTSVLFSGTPCQINALKLFLKRDYDNLLCVAVICHGVPSPLLWSKYINSVCGKKKITSVNFRAKPNGWSNFEMSIKFSKGKTISQHHANNIYFHFFLKDINLRPSCYSCNIKLHTCSTDLFLGDLWGGAKIMSDFADDLGTSFVVTTSKKGSEYLDKIADKIAIAPIDLTESIKHNPTLCSCQKYNPKRDDFYKDLNALPFRKFIKKYDSRSKSQKIKMLVKSFIRKSNNFKGV